jgi:two-component system cell cycle response regulator DivK
MQNGAAPLAKTILLAEDFDDIRDAMRILIEVHGYRVVEATDGREAVERAREYVPDLILMDIAMPVVDGVEAIRQIRSDPQISHIPIVAVTSFSNAFHAEALAAGCNRVIDKPEVFGDLGRLLETLLEDVN